MHKPAPHDLSLLIKLLSQIGVMQTTKGRESVLIAASLQDIRSQLDLEGPPLVVIPILLQTLINYGTLPHGEAAVVQFLNTAREYVGDEQRSAIDEFLKKTKSRLVPNISLKESRLPPSEEDLIPEKIIGENTLKHITYLRRALKNCSVVGQIVVEKGDERWSATAFFVSNSMLMTNHHVLNEPNLAKFCAVLLNYELDEYGREKEVERKKLRKSGSFITNAELDYCIFEIDDPPSSVALPTFQSKPPRENDRVNIIQHPGGLAKQIAFQNNFVNFVDSKRVHYVTSTLPGSSGSPIFNDDWEIIGLHRAGGWIKRGSTNPQSYFENQGVLIGPIFDSLPAEIRSRISRSSK